MRLFYLFVSVILFISCRQSSDNHLLIQSTSNDSTIYYYQLGWQQIMDEGRWTQSEVSYRKALEFDSEFLIGKSVLARLTTDLEERLALFDELQAKKARVKGDERLALDVYIGLTHFTNVREQSPEKAKAVLDSVYLIFEKNFKTIVHKYPEETYIKAEYIEVIHSLQGAEAALDSLAILASPTQKEVPFYIAYAASMEAEIGKFDEALTKADHLFEVVGDSSFAGPYAVTADIYFAMDSLEKAKAYIDRAVELDPKHIIANRLKVKVNEAILNDNSEEVK